MGGEDFGEIGSEELVFTFKPNARISCHVTLINMSNNYIGYDTKATHPNLHHARPNTCVLKPCSTCEVTVTRQAQDAMPLPRAIAKEKKLMFERAFVSQDTSANDIRTLFRSKAYEKRINRKKLKVVVFLDAQERIMSMQSRMKKELALWEKEDGKVRLKELELFVKDDENLMSELMNLQKNANKSKKTFIGSFFKKFV